MLGACGETRAPSPPAVTQAPSPTAAPSTLADAASPASARRLDAAAEAPTDFLDIRDQLPDIMLDLRYATETNFTGKTVYPKARCLLRRPVHDALVRVQERLRHRRLQLIVWDCYRPFSVQERFWKLVPDGRYVAKPKRDHQGRPITGSKHNRGAAVDVALADSQGTLLEMPTDFDDFSPRAHRGAPASIQARANAERLEAAMIAEGFVPMPTEWWHFDYTGWQDFVLSDEPL